MSDEHGPAYPDPNDNWEDRGGNPVKCPACLFMSAMFVVVLIVLAICWGIDKAAAMDHGFDPLAPTTRWMESLLQPDYPRDVPYDPPPSCCGMADAYQADTYRDNHNGTWTVVITDGDAIEYPDGRRRTPVTNGTSIVIPTQKVNPPSDQAGNPTGHAWIFMSAYENKPGYIYCFIPLPEGS